jgi:hypothetical protein
LELGYANVDAMLAEMSSAQFTEWQLYFGIEPFGSQLLDVHFASFQSLFANANRPKNQSAYQPKEFMLSKQATNANPLSVFQKLKSFMNVQKGIKKNG